MKTKSLWGCSTNGIIYTPSNIPILWLPKTLAYKLHKWLNK